MSQTKSPPITLELNRYGIGVIALENLHKLDWIRHDKSPREEYYVSRLRRPYTYSAYGGDRTYESQTITHEIMSIADWLQEEVGVGFDACFMNRYMTGGDHLGWHSDDSPSMDPSRPIAVLSFGFPREIWFRQRPELYEGEGNPPVHRFLLGHGSLLVMAAGMQQEWQHRIPKASVAQTSPRISMTFRGMTHEPVSVEAARLR